MTHSLDSNDFDALERRATELYYRTYGEPTSDEERLLVQRGIGAMRYAVAVRLDEMSEKQAPS